MSFADQMSKQVFEAQMALGKTALEIVMELAKVKWAAQADQEFQIGNDRYVMKIFKKETQDESN